MTILTRRDCGFTLKGAPVLIHSKTFFEFWKSKDSWKSVLSLYYDKTGYENGFSFWISLNILRRQWGIWILCVDPRIKGVTK